VEREEGEERKRVEIAL
jgi:hypothetical protein